jgi:penicillin-binding protein 1A
LRKILVIAVATIVVLIIAVVVAAWAASPNPTELSARVDRAIARTGGTPVALSSIPALFREAVIATEDERFYRHHGIDSLGVLRALAYDVTHFSAAQGASTITEQLTKLLYLNGNDADPWRKLLDAITAFRLERRYSKETILDSYLNVTYFGHGAYGIGAAADRYFGEAPAQLTLAQSSLIAGLIQAPSAYDPFEHPSAARARQIGVLRSMVRNGFVTKEEGAAILAQPLRLRDGSVLDAVTGVSLAPGSLLSGEAVLIAVLLLGAAVLATLIGRGRGLAPAYWWAVAAVFIAGLFMAARALRSA